MHRNTCTCIFITKDYVLVFYQDAENAEAGGTDNQAAEEQETGTGTTDYEDEDNDNDNNFEDEDDDVDEGLQ